MLPTMGERNQAEPEGGTGAADPEPRRGTRYSVPEVARALGISERAVRKRITAGTLDAEKDGAAWAVFLPAGTRAEPEAVPAAPTEPGAVPGTAQGAAPGGTDVEPLAALIGDLSRENRQLAEAAAVWQFRALQAEDRLKVLTAGEPEQVAPVSRQDGPGTPEGAAAAEESRSGFRGWWRRVWGGS